MATTSEYESKVLVETIPRDSFWSLIITVEVKNLIPQGLVFDLASFIKPFVILKADQEPSFELLLKRFKDGIWRHHWAVPIDLEQRLPQFIVAFWNHILEQKFEVDTWKVALEKTPIVSR